MIEIEKQTIAKLETLKNMAPETSVKELAEIQIEYIKSVSKADKIGFKTQDER